MMCTMPWLRLPISNSLMPNSRALRRIASICATDSSSAIGSSPDTCRGSVGTLWSIVARVRSGTAHGPARDPEAVEGLRRGHLVDEVQVDVQQVGLVVAGADHVLVPDLLDEGLRRRACEPSSGRCGDGAVGAVALAFS